jgi:hypothetical protein
MKSYTSLEQSKKLAEFLPIESADMRFCFSHTLGGRITGHYPMIGREPSLGTIPCWSLAALLGIIRKTIGYTIYGVNDVYISCELGDKPWKIETEVYDNEVDACYEILLKLHELEML